MNHQLLIRKNFFKWHYKEICDGFQRKNKKNCGRTLNWKKTCGTPPLLPLAAHSAKSWLTGIRLTWGKILLFEWLFWQFYFTIPKSLIVNSLSCSASIVSLTLTSTCIEIIGSTGSIIIHSLVFSPSLSKSSYLCFEGALWNRGFCRHRRPSWILHLPVEAPPSSTFGSLVDKEVDHSACTPWSKAAPPWYCTWTAPHLWSLWGWSRLGNDSLPVCKVFLLSRETQQVFQGFWKSWKHLWSILPRCLRFITWESEAEGLNLSQDSYFQFAWLASTPSTTPWRTPLRSLGTIYSSSV